LNLGARDQFSGPTSQKSQQTSGLILQPDPSSVPEKLRRIQIQFERFETDPPGRRFREGFHVEMHCTTGLAPLQINAL